MRSHIFWNLFVNEWNSLIVCQSGSPQLERYCNDETYVKLLPRCPGNEDQKRPSSGSNFGIYVYRGRCPEEYTTSPDEGQLNYFT